MTASRTASPADIQAAINRTVDQCEGWGITPAHNLPSMLDNFNKVDLIAWGRSVNAVAFIPVSGRKDELIANLVAHILAPKGTPMTTDPALPHMTPAEADAAIAQAAVKLRAELSMPLSDVEELINVDAWLWSQGIDPDSATDADVRRAREAIGQPDAFPAETFPVESTLTAHIALTRPGTSVDDCELTELVGRVRAALLADPQFVGRYSGATVAVTVPLADDMNADSYTSSFEVPA